MIKIRKLKIMPLVIAVVLLVAGLVMLGLSYGGVPGPALAIFVGTLILGVGTTRLVYGFLTYTEELDARNNITLGVLDAVWGILMLCLNNNDLAFVLLFGLWCLIACVLETIEIVKNAIAKRPYIHLLADAIINLTFGITMIAVNSKFSILVGIYLVLNALTSGLVTILTITGIKVGNKEIVPEPVAEAKEEPAAEEKVEAPVVEEVAEEKPAAKKTTTRKTTTTKSTTAKKTTTTKSTGAKTTAAKKTTTTKKTTAKKAE